MNKKDISSLWVALLGVLIGVLLTLLCTRIQDKKDMRADTAGWRKLNLILNTAVANYVDTIDYDKVTEEAAIAALQALDPHSVYMPPVELKQSQEDIDGNFEGIGIQFNVPNDTAIVLEVISGGPSEKIGLQKGDRLIKVDDKVIAGVKFPQDSMVRRMKGPAGTKVTVTVARGPEIIPFEITRDKIVTSCIDAAFMLDASTGYLRLSKFTPTTAVEAQEAISGLVDKGMKHLLFDLRENSGGYFDQSIRLADLFLEKGCEIVYMEGIHRKRETYNATGRGPFKDLDLLVLIDENSASASEVFAGSMQDNGRAKLVGRRSFGKGLVQEPFQFTDGSGFRLTVARFYTPSGRVIQKPYTDDYHYEVYKRYDTGEMICRDSIKTDRGGIIPDIFVPLDTTKAGKFYIACNRKATLLRFSSAFFDSHREALGAIDNYPALLKYLDNAGLEQAFLAYAKQKDGLEPSAQEWKGSKIYMMTQLRALVGRYSKLGENAFYHLYLDTDDGVKAARAAIAR